MADEQSDVLDRLEKRLPELPADKPSVDMSPPPVASSPGIADFAKVPEGLKSDLIGAVRGKQQAVAGVNAQTDRRVEEDRTRALQLGATGVGPESEIKPWDAKAKAQEYSHDPLDSFGSFASIFAITASAFTKAPFENALNGSAAAINAIKAGDEKGYERAYTAWKDNNELAIKRATLQHQKYQEAMDLMKTDMNRGAAKALAVAAQFDDQKSIALIQNGMIPEFFQTQAAAAQATQGMAQASEKITEMTFRKAAQDVLVSQANGDPVKMLQAFNTAHGIVKPVDQELMTRFLSSPKADGSMPTPDDAAEYAAKLRRPATGSAAMTAEQVKLVGELTGKNVGEGMDPVEAHKKALEEVSAMARKGGASTRVLKPEEREINRIQAEKEKAGMEPTQAYKEAVQEVKRAGVVPTAKLRDDLTGKIDRVDNMDHTIDQVEKLLKKHSFITGLGGTVRRPVESISNALGVSSQTDARQFERWVYELQEWAPRALTDSSGRPLSADAAKVTGIIAGLRPGDTSANTLRAYSELKPLLKKMRGDLVKRRDGAATEGAPVGEGGPAVAGASSAPWLNDPVK